MTVRIIIHTLWLAPLAALALVAGASLVGTEVEPGLQTAKTGVVLDAANGEPLPGVYVGARWMLQTQEPALLGGKLEGRCIYRFVVRTDAQGRYTIPTAQIDIAKNLLPGGEKSYFWDLYTYAAGYSTSSPVAVAHPRAISDDANAESELEPILLAATHDTPQQRLPTLTETLAHFTCHPYAHDAGPIEQSIAAEAAAAACLPGSASVDASCSTFRQASSRAP